MKIKFAIFALLIFIFSCSSQPKNSGDVFHLRSQTEKELEVALKEAGRGNYETAQSILEECKRKAILADDWGLIIRCGISLGNVLFSLGRNDAAFSEWEKSIQLAQKNNDKELLSVSKIYLARGALLTGVSSAQDALNNVNREAVNLKSGKLYIAFSWQVKGLAYRAMGSFKEAEEAFKQSLSIHEKEKYLDNASYDWYNIASIRSMSGNMKGALQALEEAIKLDRRIENSWALAANWRAMGDVNKKAGNNKAANEAYQRAKDIYTALGNFKDAAEIDKRMENLSENLTE